MAKRKQKQRQRKIDPQEKAMIDAVTSMANVLVCPVLVASDHAENCADLAERAECDVRIAPLSAELHAGSGELEIKLRAALEDFIVMRERQELELSRLCARFAELDDHDVEHSHVEIGDEHLRRVAFAMFGMPTGAEEHSET